MALPCSRVFLYAGGTARMRPSGRCARAVTVPPSLNVIFPNTTKQLLLHKTPFMEYLEKQAAIARMNSLSAAGVPFIFIIDYAARRSVVMPANEVDPGECLFDFGTLTNATGAVAENAGPVEWEAAFPSEEEYKAGFDRVAASLQAGEISLINLTCRVPVRTNLSLRDVFCRSEARYKLWVKDTLVCFSPEIFVRIENGEISSYPMKGTIRADRPEALQAIMDDVKEAEEHASVVALIRDDLSRVSNAVWVERYRYADRLTTNRGDILQTSSEVRGKLPADWPARVGDILFSQLPAGSITGAPKEATVRVIAEAESYDRGFYTGVMGWCDGQRLDSSVMIRFIDCEDGHLYYKAGGGITARSRWDKEYKEVKQKTYVPIR